MQHEKKNVNWYLEKNKQKTNEGDNYNNKYKKEKKKT